MIRTRMFVCLGLLVAGTASADQPRDIPPQPVERLHTRAWKATPLVGTVVGADVAAGIQVEAPNRLRIMATAGIMPDVYAWGVSQLATDSELLENLLQDLAKFSFVATANVSYRVLPNRGFFVGAGYGFQYVSKGGLLAAQFEQGANEMLPASDAGAARRFDTTVHLDVLTGMFGWEWAVGSGFMLRGAIGVIVPVHSSTTLEPEFVPSNPAMTEAFTNAVSNKLEDAATWLVVPSASLYLGYTFY